MEERCGRLLAAGLMSFVLGACVNSRTPAPVGAEGGRTMDKRAPSTWDKVREQAGPGVAVSHYEEVKVPGLELFVLAKEGRDPSPRRGVAVPAGASAWLEGKEAMRAAMDRGASDAATLARLSILLLQPDGDLDTATAPALSGKALEYRYRSSQGMARNLYRATLDLGTLELHSEAADAAPDPVAEARQILSSGSQIVWRTAVQQLKGLCGGEPRALALLLETAAQHRDTATRAEAAEAAGACRSPAALGPLRKLLAGEGPDPVRIGAAAGLGLLGGKDAEAALREAGAGPGSPELKSAIGRALRRLASAP